MKELLKRFFLSQIHVAKIRIKLLIKQVLFYFFISNVKYLFFFFHLDKKLPGTPSFCLPTFSRKHTMYVYCFFFNGFSSVCLHCCKHMPSPIHNNDNLLIIN